MPSSKKPAVAEAVAEAGKPKRQPRRPRQEPRPPQDAPSPGLQPGVSIGVRMSAPEMWRLDWERREAVENCEDDGSLPLSLGLALSRTGPESLQIELSVEVDAAQARVRVACRSQWAIDDLASFPDVQSALNTIAARLGPSALYPFAREAIASASLKAGLAPIVLPIINFGDFFNPEEVHVPLWEAGPEAKAE